MKCSEFLAGYSEYLDGLAAGGEAGFRDHMSACASCRRYDRVLRGGLEVVRRLDEVEPGPDFQERLHRRLWAEHVRGDERSQLTAAAVSLALAAAIAIVAWSPLLRGAQDRSAPVTADPAAGAAVERSADGDLAAWPVGWEGPYATRGGAAGRPAAWSNGSQPSLVELSVTLPGPYSPLEIGPPLDEAGAFLTRHTN